MKKDYHFTISRTDRICLVSFVMVLLAWELIKGLFPGGEKMYAYVPREHAYEQKNKPEYMVYNKSTYTKNYKSKSYPDNYYGKSKQNDFPNQTPPPHPLPIMTASINELTSMGLSVKVAFNIHKFIAAGGIITKSEDMLKIYGMDSTQLLLALPHLVYAPPDVKADKDFPKKNYPIESKPGIIDLNTATVSELESLNGIGNVLAERIIKFRESLRGFRNVNQLKDCYGITPELFEQLNPQLTVTGSGRMIMINQQDLSALTHPYLNKKMIRLIEAYRDHHGPFTSAKEFKKVYPHDSTCFNKILPYLSFE